jgi:hypothetical protein
VGRRAQAAVTVPTSGIHFGIRLHGHVAAVRVTDDEPLLGHVARVAALAPLAPIVVSLVVHWTLMTLWVGTALVVLTVIFVPALTGLAVRTVRGTVGLLLGSLRRMNRVLAPSGRTEPVTVLVVTGRTSSILVTAPGVSLPAGVGDEVWVVADILPGRGVIASDVTVADPRGSAGVHTVWPRRRATIVAGALATGVTTMAVLQSL